MAYHCPIIGCSSGSYRLMKWKAAVCEIHGVPHESAAGLCDPPFRLHALPTCKKKPAERDKWIRLISRIDGTAKEKLWSPSKNARVCSKHFIDGKPTEINPYPTKDLGYQGCEEKAARVLRYDPAASLGPSRRKRLRLVFDNPANLPPPASDITETNETTDTTIPEMLPAAEGTFWTWLLAAYIVILCVTWQGRQLQKKYAQSLVAIVKLTKQNIAHQKELLIKKRESEAQ